MILIATLALIFTVFLYKWHIHNRRLAPGPWGIPILGSIPFMNFKDPISSFSQLKQKYGSVVSVTLGNRLVVYLLDIQVIREAFEKQAEVFSGRFDFLPMTTGNRGLGIALTDGPKWQIVRRFAQSRLRDYGMGKLSMEVKIHDEIDAFSNVIQKHRGNPFRPFFPLITANVIANIVFGKRFDYNDPLFLSCIDSMLKGFSSMPGILVLASFNSLFKFLPEFKRETAKYETGVRDFWGGIIEMINQKRLNFDLANEPDDFLSAMIREADRTEGNRAIYYEKSPIGVGDTLSIVVTQLFTGGTETTSTTLEWAFAILIKYPEIQQKLQTELYKVVGEGRKPSYEDRRNLPLCDAFCMEVQRFGNIGLFAIPHRTIRDTNLQGYFIPKDTVVMPLLGLIHRDENYFRDAGTFDLNRFIRKDGTVDHRCPGFLPFSTGKRVCLGDSLAKRELFLVVTGLLQRFHFSVPTGQKEPTLNRVYGITTHAEAFDMVAFRRQ